MDCSIKGEKIQAMKNYKRAKFLYNIVLYSLTSLITCFFISYSFWFPSMKHFLSSFPDNFFFILNAKCFFIIGNIIILILIIESKLERSSDSSSTSDIYDEYVARSRRIYKNVNSQEIVNGVMKNLKIEEKKHGGQEKISKGDEKKKEMRVCNSTMPNEEKKKEMRLCKSIIMPRDEEKKKGMRTSKSEVWGESEIVEREKTNGKKREELYMQREELNKRVEAFIARVNKQRLLEAKLVDHYRG